MAEMLNRNPLEQVNSVSQMTVRSTIASCSVHGVF